MTGFTPGDGWREVDADEEDVNFRPRELLVLHTRDEAERHWVRVDPVPPLPTAPNTCIRATWKMSTEGEPPGTALPTMDMVLREDGIWRTYGDNGSYDADAVQRSITGFEVLAEPRNGQWVRLSSEAAELVRVGMALAVLDRVLRDPPPHDAHHQDRINWRERLLREFGVKDR